MTTFLAMSVMFMIIIVKGDDEVTISGCIGKSVLLPCNCSNRSLTKRFEWQFNDSIRVFYHNDGTSEFKNGYKDRATVFEDGNKRNCSLRLKNITTDDQRPYKCIFYIGDEYHYRVVHINISAFQSDCPDHSTRAGPEQFNAKDLKHLIILFPVLVVLGLFLFLCRRKISRCLLKLREEKTQELPIHNIQQCENCETTPY